jgi:phosphatidylglycerophosphatase A
MKGLARLVASGLGCGFAPRAPGTVGSLAALVVGAALLLGPAWVLPVAALVACVAGVWAIRAAGATGDPGWVVIDEFAGMWITLLGVQHVSAVGLVAAFVVFRVLDITKLGPIGWADRRHGAMWVMADDIIAGVIGAVLLWGVWR